MPQAVKIRNTFICFVVYPRKLQVLPEDILSLAEYFLANQADFYDEPAKTLNPAAKELLLNHSWPGNIRELANAIEHAYVLTPGSEIQPAAMPFEILIADSPSYPGQELPTLDDVKRRIITQTLEFTKGRKIAAAKILKTFSSIGLSWGV